MRVDVSAKIISFPQVCACCLGHADNPIRATARGKTWTIPHCSGCLRHATAYESASQWLYYGTIAGLLGGVLMVGLVGIAGGPVVGVVLGGGTFMAATVAGYLVQSSKQTAARAMCSPSCGTITRIATFLGWHGHVQSFFFGNDQYALRFMEVNMDKLVNLTAHARHALAWQLGQRAEAARAAAAEHAVRMQALAAQHAAQLEEIEVPVWLTRIEEARGPASRRAVLAKALDATTRRDLRDRLMLEASQIEVRAVLDKADGLKTPAAKRRVLSEALATLRADDVPDELQAEQIRWLEEALAETHE